MLTIVSAIPNAWARHGHDSQKIPFKLYRSEMVVVTGRLGDLENRNLLIDTGANPTVVDEALARDLNLKPVGRPQDGMTIVGGVVQTYYAVLQSLDLGPIHRDSLQVAVANLSLMQGQVGVRIDAIVGLDTLEPYNFQIDYQSKKITFGRIHIASPVAMLETNPFVIVEARINGSPAALAVDTGASRLILLRDALPGVISNVAIGSQVPLANVAGDVTFPQIQLSELQIGDMDLSGSTAVLVTIPKCCQFHGMLGVSSIHFRRVSFDFQNRLFGLELAGESKDVFSDQRMCSSVLDDCRRALRMQ